MKSISHLLQGTIPQIPDSSKADERIGTMIQYADMLELALIQIAQALNQCKEFYGLKNSQMDEVAQLEQAKNIVDQVWAVRRSAKLKDVLEAINLFGIGEIKLKDQLNVVSIQNIVQAYKFYMDVYLPEKRSQMKPIHSALNADRQLESGVHLQNLKARREMFATFIQNPKDNILAMKFYDILVDIGAITASPEEKVIAYKNMAFYHFNAGSDPIYPTEFMLDRAKRMQFRLFMDEWLNKKQRQNPKNHGLPLMTTVE